jgi:hypothetical protein
MGGQCDMNGKNKSGSQILVRNTHEQKRLLGDLAIDERIILQMFLNK